MTPLVAEELTLEPEETPTLVRLRWLGRSVSRDPGKVLRPYFQELLADAETRHRAIEMHFEKLEHFNSSTIAALIQLINSARDRKLQLKLVYDGNLKWQSLSFDALKRALRPFEDGGSSTVTIAAL